MAASQNESPEEAYFNDLSQQIPGDGAAAEERRASQEDNGQLPKQKRIACVLCRKRKLKCDGQRPACATCTRLQHDCVYDEVRRKSGPKRGYVKALEARLAQVETLLRTQDEPVPRKQQSKTGQNGGIPPELDNIALGQNMQSAPPRTFNMLNNSAQSRSMLDGTNAATAPNVVIEEPFSWDMIGLGLDEPLPTQDVINDLNQVYFDKIHPSLPVIHRPRYYAAMNLAPHVRPPVALRYSMWANAASVTDKYEGLHEHLYERARKYMHQDEMKGHGETMVTLAHCQAWILIATYEFKAMYFPRAWMSSGRASRMAQMMGLHRMDGVMLDVKQCLPPPKDWTEREERRRTFWMAFCVDRYSSIGTGWPMIFDERDITSTLPSSDSAYELSKPAKTSTLAKALEQVDFSQLSGFGGVVLMASLFGRNLLHLHRPGVDERDDDLNGEFWNRHREMDNTLLNTSLSLPDALRLPSAVGDPNVIFLNMNIHTSTICLHQAAIYKVDKNGMPSRMSSESKVRCLTAAGEIANIMRQASHMDVSAMNPFISFCLYVAARVFVQYLRSRPSDMQIAASLQFLLAAMAAIKRKNPLTESFLVQLDVDMEAAGLEDARQTFKRQAAALSAGAAGPNRSECCPMTEFLQMDPISGNKSCGKAYGDDGLGMYNNPRTAGNIVPATLEQFNLHHASTEMAEYLTGTASVDLPNRQRTPGSVNFTSPNSNGREEMDTSPDGSANDHTTPNSSTMSQQNYSSRTSHTGYSPQTQQQQQQQNASRPLGGTASNLQDQPMQATFMFDGSDFSNMGLEGFAMPEGQPMGGTGFTPGPMGSTGFTPGPTGPTGFTPGPTGMTPGTNNGITMGVMDEMMNGMTEADWSQMLDGLDGGTSQHWGTEPAG